MLFENISTIGLLKSLGMTDRGITGVFMSSSAILVGKGMAIGNALAIAFCILQDKTHLLRLDPENYYVSFVPVDLDLSDLLITDVVSFAVIMLLLLIPSLFISRVDPAETVRVR
jgi:lipoprotein-releasing system permease protein